MENMKQSAIGSKLVDRNDIIIKDDMVALGIEVKERLSKLQESIGMEELSMQKNTKPSIYKIPEFMREVHPKAYEPQLVSLGPYHHGKHRLLPMEREKQKGFLRFKSKNNLDFESIVERVSSILEHLLGSYDKLQDIWKLYPAKFLEVMIVDACFLLDFITECPQSLSSMIWDIKRDMLLLENQLPMNLLKQLHAIRTNEQKHLDLESMVWDWLRLSGESSMNYLHILDMYRASLLCPTIYTEDVIEKMKTILELNPADMDANCQSIPPATQLRRAGIKFEKSSTSSLMDVSFDCERRMLRLPSLAIDDILTEPTLINIMAFEKLHIGVGSQAISFVMLMKNLIRLDKDVWLLASKGILSNAIHDRDGVVQLFNRLAKGQNKSLESRMHDLFKILNWCCNNQWTIWWANLKLPQTQNPWPVIYVATFMLPIITTIFNDGYRRPKQ